jgi:hypothetical protein
MDSKMESVNANSLNRAFVGQNHPMGFSTSSPSATMGGGQSNSPVSYISFSYLISGVWH